MSEPITLLENLRAVFYAPFYMAVDRGYFADAGVDVRFVESPDPGDTLPRLMSGEVDVCWGGPLRVMRTHDQQPGCGLVCFGEVVGRDPFFLVGKGFSEDFSLAGLKGKRLAVVSEVPTPWVCLRQDLIDAGVDVADITVIEGRTMAQNEAALAAGEIDAFMAFQPFAERGGRQDGARVIYTAADRGPAAYTCFYTTREAMDRRRDDFRGMASACKRAVQELYAEGAGAAVPTLVKYFPNEPAELLEAAVARYLRHKLYNPTGALPEEGVGWLKRAMLTTGTIKGDVPFSECVDNSLV
jgi:NitT/TauT family transport system substrate-binding protein